MKRNLLQVLRTPQWRETIATLAALALILQSAPAQAPQWWTSQGVFTTGATPDDYAAANVGQLKNMAQKAAQEMNLRLVNGTGGAVHGLLESWPLPGAGADDYAVLTAGQLKAAAQPFLDRMSFPRPWPANGQSDDYAVVNVGQLKNAFSFPIPQQTLPAWAATIPPAQLSADRAIWDALVADGAAAIGSSEWDFDGDGIPNLQEYLMGTLLIDPNDIDGDGISNADEDLYPDAILNKRVFADAVNDPDADGALNFEEVLELHSDPTRPFSRHVGGTIPDGQIMAWEAAFAHDPVLFEDETGYEVHASDFGFTNEADQDGNGLPDGLDTWLAYEEPEDGSGYGIDTNYAAMPPIGSNDLDRDAMPNLWEYRYGLLLRGDDAGREYGHALVSPPVAPVEADYDVDGDGSLDEFELELYNQADLAYDSELARLLMVDPDGDRLTNLREFLVGTHPRLGDSDGDGFPDGAEVLAGQNAVDVMSILPPAVRVVSGNGQSGIGGGPLPAPFVVEVSRGDRVWPAEPVTFESIVSGLEFSTSVAGPWSASLQAMTGAAGLASAFVRPPSIGGGWKTVTASISGGAAVSGSIYHTPGIPPGPGSPTPWPGPGGGTSPGPGQPDPAPNDREAEREVFGAIRIKMFRFEGTEGLSDEEKPETIDQSSGQWEVWEDYDSSSDAFGRFDDGINADHDLEDNPFDFGDPRDELYDDDTPDDGSDSDGDGDPDDPDEPTGRMVQASDTTPGAVWTSWVDEVPTGSTHYPESEPTVTNGTHELFAHNRMEMVPPFKQKGSNFEFNPSIGEAALDALTWHRPENNADFHGWRPQSLSGPVEANFSWEETTEIKTGQLEGGGSYSVPVRTHEASGQNVQFRLQTNFPVAAGASIERTVLLVEESRVGSAEPTYVDKGSITLRIPEGEVVATEVVENSDGTSQYIKTIGSTKVVELQTSVPSPSQSRRLILLPVEVESKDRFLTGSFDTSIDLFQSAQVEFKNPSSGENLGSYKLDGSGGTHIYQSKDDIFSEEELDGVVGGSVGAGSNKLNQKVVFWKDGSKVRFATTFEGIGSVEISLSKSDGTSLGKITHALKADTNFSGLIDHLGARIDSINSQAEDQFSLMPDIDGIPDDDDPLPVLAAAAGATAASPPPAEAGSNNSWSATTRNLLSKVLIAARNAVDGIKTGAEYTYKVGGGFIKATLMASAMAWSRT